MSSVLFNVLCVFFGLFILVLSVISIVVMTDISAVDYESSKCCRSLYDGHSFSGGIMINGKLEDPFIFKKGKVIGLYDTCFLKEEKSKVDYVSSDWGTVCFIHEIESKVNYVFYFSLAAAILLGAIAGYQYKNMDNKPEEVKLASKKKKKRFLVLAVIILAVAILVKCGLINFLSSASR